MPVQELEVIISSDVNSAVKGAQEVGSAFTKVEKQASGSLSKSLQNIERLLEQISKTSYTSSSSLTSNFQRIPKEVSNTTKSLAAAEVGLKKVGNSGVNTQQVFNGLNNTVRDLPFGFIAIQNNLTQVADALLGAGKAALFIGFGFSVAITAVTQLTQKYGSLGNAINQIFNLESDAEKQSRRISTIRLDAAKSVGAEIAQLEILRTKLIDLNAPQDDRKKALEAFNKIADENNKLSEKDINNLSKINYLITNQISLLGKRAIAAAAQKSLSAEADKFFEVQKRTEPILGRVSSLLTQQGDAAREAIKGVKGLRLATEEEVAADSSFANNVKRDLSALAAIRSSSEYKKAEKELKKASDAFNAALGQVAPFIDYDGLTIKDTTKATIKKDVKTVSDVLKALENDMGGLRLAFASTGGSVRSLAEDSLKVLEKALKDLYEVGVRPGDKVFQQIDDQIKAIQASLAKTPVTLKIPIIIEPIPKAQSNQSAEAFKQAVDSFNPLTKFEQNFQDRVQEAVRGGAASFASGIGEAIGEIAAGGKDLNAVFNGVIGVFGSFIKQLGESMIAAGTAAIAAKFLIKNPYTAVAAGIIAVAAGAAISASLNKAPSFATGGGVVGGPTLAMIGDNPGREEYVIPSEVLDKMGGGDGFIARTEIQGDKIALLVYRALQQEGRIN